MISKEEFYGKRNYNKNGGITLIALVITIIVLLILPGVTIAALSGDNGILTRAKEAKEKTEQAQKDEEKTLSNMENILGVYSFKNINVADTNPGGVVPETDIRTQLLQHKEYKWLRAKKSDRYIRKSVKNDKIFYAFSLKCMVKRDNVKSPKKW